MKMKGDFKDFYKVLKDNKYNNAHHYYFTRKEYKQRKKSGENIHRIERFIYIFL